MRILITGTAGLPGGIIFKFFKNSQQSWDSTGREKSQILENYKRIKHL
jgi:hypothetical protein